MPKRDDDLLISDMIDCCHRIIDYVKGMNYESFITDNKTVDAVIRNFEVLGEACKYVSVEIKSNNPFIEWRKYIQSFVILVYK